MSEYRHTIQNMSEAMKELEGAITGGRFHHNGDPILNWEASNVTNKVDKKGNYFPDKESEKNKIDGMIGCIMAVGRAMFDLEIESSVYDERDIRELG